MKKGPPLILALALSACSVTRIETTVAERPGAELAFVAVRSGDRPTGGYALELKRNGRPVAVRACRFEDPVLLHGLEPGIYDATVRGAHGRSCELRLRLRPDHRTTLVVLHEGMRRRERAEEVLTTVAEGSVKVVGIAVLGVVKGIGWLCEAWWEDDEEDEGPPEGPGPITGKTTPKSKVDQRPEPRIKNWLKTKP